MSLDRRTFLASLAGAPLIFGLDGLAFGFQDDKKKPAWFAAALKRMKEKNRPGVVVVPPPAPDASSPARDEQKRVGIGLWELVDGDHAEAHELFTGAVFIYLSPALAAELGIRKAGDESNRILLDPDAKRIAADVVPVEVFEDPAKFTESFRKFIHGETGGRLKQRADAQRENLAADVRAALGQLEADDLDVRESASALLFRNIDSCHDLVVYERSISTSDEKRGRLGQVLKKHYALFEAQVPGTRLPYGSRIPEMSNSGCGGQREVEEGGKAQDEAMRCGMMRVSDLKTQKFLRFLAK